jgi:hypothetical protein
MKLPWPELGFSNPERSISKLDLPAPEGPVMAYDYPWFIDKSRFSNKVIVEALFSNDCETAFNSIEQDMILHHSNIW